MSRLVPPFFALACLLTACASPPRQASAPSSPTVTQGTGEPSPATPRPPLSSGKAPAQGATAYTLKKGGGFYKDDGPGEEIPVNLDQIPDPEPRWEALHKPAMRPYVVLGREYVPATVVKPYRARGIASWYGRKFHGQKTSIGEPYDMFAMTAAHPTLALPSYVRVSNPVNGRQVIVRVIDRGPFHADRIIDLSYAAAWKLGLIVNGSGEVVVEAIIPDGAPANPAPTTPPAAETDPLDTLIARMVREEAVPVSNETSRGIWLQLGAFSNPDNAEALRMRLGRELDWLGDRLRVQREGSIHRLRAGPYASRAEAEKAAERVRLAMGVRPAILGR